MLTRPGWVAVWALTSSVLGVLLRAGVICAAERRAPSFSKGETGRIETKADKLNYNRRTGWIEAVGHVVVKKGDAELRADYARVNLKTEDAYAFGNVTLVRAGTVWTGRELHYNFNTGRGLTTHLTGNVEPFRWEAKESEKGAGNEYILHDAMVTTCTNKYPHCHYHVKARKVTVIPDDHLVSRGAVWYFGRVPVLYLPYWYRNLRGDFGFRFYPGYNSRMGAFLLSSYRYRLNPVLRGETHVDYRDERGLAGGQDFKWRQAQGEWYGDLSLYYADDRDPLDEDEDPETADIDNDRYRVRLSHDHNFSQRDYMLLQLHYLSDTDILEDFFEDEYRESSQPENYLAYTHRGDKFAANLLLRARLNDFYSSINRLPECSVDFMRQQLGTSSFYYEGQTAASYLEKVWEESNSDEQDYSVFRIDSSHMVYRPAKHFGFLNLIPRAGYRGTYYSQTRGTITTIETTVTAETNLVVDVSGNTNTVVTTVTETNSVTTEVETGGDLRSRVELGLEASFKAFKTWDDAGGGRRHIVEPYANYAFALEPTLLPENIYQFDEVDTLQEEHWTRLGVRNKFQTKRDGQPFDLVDVDVYTIYKIERGADEDAIDSIFFDAELWPADWLQIDLDGQFDVQESNTETFNSQVSLSQEDLWTAGVEYRFIDGESSLLTADLTLLPDWNWTFNIYGRYEFEDSRVEEQGGYIQRNLDCMGIRTGVNVMPGYTKSDGSEVEDEWRVIVELWLTAFPEVSLAGRHKN